MSLFKIIKQNSYLNSHIFCIVINIYEIISLLKLFKHFLFPYKIMNNSNKLNERISFIDE